ncbi:MAG: MFS transporter [Defluviicoccus sp.]|nr:MFS transporter [Defluviicoccus sp.]MDG4591370.1 MFS transporter [Defluviicoccus sp.]MDS4012229.1 MFS transporter [Defluviicoccus sp.]MDS4071622.1 MFS transporter [Defluviicoccus sp.]
MAKSEASGRIINVLTMFLVAGLSLALLLYIAFGEAHRTFAQFYVEKMAAQGAVVQTAIEKQLRLGLPLEQYAGFSLVAGRVNDSDPTVVSIVAFDAQGQAVFVAGSRLDLLTDPAAINRPSSSTYELRQSPKYLQVQLPLRSREARVGTLAVTMARARISADIRHEFDALPLPALLLAAAFAGFVYFALTRIKERRNAWLHGAFFLTFLTMAAGVVALLISLYAEGAQSKTRALAQSLGQRLSDLVAFNVNIKDIRGLDRTLAEYRQVNPEISAAALTVNGVVQLHTDPRRVGACWVGKDDDYNYRVDLTPPEARERIEVAVALPTRIVADQLVRCIKNFAALFVASAFLAGVFLQLAHSVNANGREGQPARKLSGTEGIYALNLVKPVFFGAIFLENLTYAFLPKHVDALIASEGLSSAFVSVPFVAYWVSFAFILLPAGYLAEKINPRPLIYGGLALAGLAMLMLELEPGFAMFVAARLMAGVGQGLLFIGVQTYILIVAPPNKKTQGNAIIVMGYQGGMISGMAIGSLLVGSLGAEGVFMIAALVAIGLAVYVFFCVPHYDAPEGCKLAPASPKEFARSLGIVVRDRDFLATMLCIGIPAKAVLTGIIVFALPLLLNQQNFPQEDIGQIVMVYAAAVMIASVLASRHVDHTGRTTNVLLWGAIVSGVGLIIIGVIGLSGLNLGGVAHIELQMPPAFTSGVKSFLVLKEANASTVALLVGVLLVGFGHGGINAPVITHVAASALATRVGQSPVAAAYRFLERIGHIAGPMLAGQLLYLSDQNPLVIAWSGLALIILGVSFATFSLSHGFFISKGARA